MPMKPPKQNLFKTPSRSAPISCDAETLTHISFRFSPSTADPSLFLRTDPSLPSFYILVYVDDLAFATADTEAVVPKHYRIVVPKHYLIAKTGRVCKLLKSLYGLKQSPLLWYKALNDVLIGAGWKKSQVEMALYFKVGANKVACWVPVYVDELLAARSSNEMLKELLEAAFELCEMAPVQKYLGLEIVHDRSARKLWLHQQGYAVKLRRRFLDEEQTGHILKMLVLVDDYVELTFDDEEAQERQEEEYRQKVGSLQFAATTTRTDIAFTCNKLRSGLTPADILTKALHYLAFNWCSIAIRQVRLADVGDDGNDMQQ
ncbi:unnamed protein product [Closterium sp. NIES-54]